MTFIAVCRDIVKRIFELSLVRSRMLLAALACLVSVSTLAQDFPQRTITLVCPFPAGGGTDILARMLAQELQDKLKQTVIVDNRVGGGTVLAAQTVAKSNPDGHTLLLAPVTTLAINPSVFKTLQIGRAHV